MSGTTTSKLFVNRRFQNFNQAAGAKASAPNLEMGMRTKLAPNKKVTKWLTIGVFIIIALCAGLLIHGGLRLLERHFIFPAGKYPFEKALQKIGPLAKQLEIKQYMVPATTNSRPSSFSASIRYLASVVDGADASVIVFHGNAGTVMDRVPDLVPQFRKRNLSSYLIEYPGYAGDRTVPSQNVVLENVLNAFDHLVRSKHLDTTKPIIIFGRSLGTAMSTFLASKRPEFIHSLFLVSPPSCIADVAQNRIPFIPFRWLLQSNFPSYKWARSVICPTTIVHGKNDAIVPIELGRKLASSFLVTPTFVEVNDAGHNDVHHVKQQLFWKAFDHAVKEGKDFSS
jgi:pimeloyl-ACP methyl ester carboxylesterase